MKPFNNNSNLYKNMLLQKKLRNVMTRSIVWTLKVWRTQRCGSSSTRSTSTCSTSSSCTSWFWGWAWILHQPTLEIRRAGVYPTKRKFSPNNPIFNRITLKMMHTFVHMVSDVRMQQDLQEMSIQKSWKTPYNVIALVVVGPSGTGKSSLKEYLPNMFKSIKMVSIHYV